MSSRKLYVQDVEPSVIQDGPNAMFADWWSYGSLFFGVAGGDPVSSGMG